MRGSGCYECVSSKISKGNLKDNEKFLEEIPISHKDKYTYPEKYIGAHTRININCKIHGLFLCSPNNHVRGKGCPKCSKLSPNRNGWSYSKWDSVSKNSKQFNSYQVYVIKCSNKETDENFIKIGRTFTTIETRFSGSKVMPYDYEILNVTKFNDALSCCLKEEELHSKFKKYKYKPLIKFRGVCECYDLNILNELQLTVEV
jgi:hypothetical protein